MNKDIPANSARSHELYEQLKKLDAIQFKMFYAAFVHYWVNHKYFISKQNFFDLWCELNLRCHEAVKSFCHYHPYYFIDRLPLDLIAELFCRYVDDRVDILTNFAKNITVADIRAAYTYINEALELSESIGDLVSETHTHIKFFSY